MKEPDITWHLCEAVNSGRSPSMDEIADAIAAIRALRGENSLYEDSLASYAQENAELRAENERLQAEMSLDAIAEQIDRLDNLCMSLTTPIPDALHVECLRELLPEVLQELKSAYLAAGGTDCWSTHPDPFEDVVASGGIFPEVAGDE